MSAPDLAKMEALWAEADAKRGREPDEGILAIRASLWRHMAPVDEHLPVGTVLAIGHPANNVTWFRTALGWIDTAGNDPQHRNPGAFFDTIGHHAYVVRRLGNGR